MLRMGRRSVLLLVMTKKGRPYGFPFSLALGINTEPDGKGYFTGNLLRNIYWKVHSAAVGL